MTDDFKFGGLFEWEILDPDGSVVSKGKFKNMTTLAGINDALSVYLASGTQKTTWFLGLIDNSGFTALNSGDTIGSHTGWAESVAYSGGVRPTWTPGSVSGQSVSNPSSVSFTMSAPTTLAGAFLVSNSTLGGTAGLLWATGAFGTPQTLATGQVFKLTYTCNGTGS